MGRDDLMTRAVELAASVRASAHPNPWVGAVVGRHFEGATEPPGGRHAEAVALDAAGDAARGADLHVTLEPCVAFDGKRTRSCAERIVDAGVARVVVALEDPDQRVRGRGIEALRAAGLDVEVGGTHEDAVRAQLAPYLHHRTTGRPFVVLKLAASIDGRTAAPDGSSQWITGDEARTDAHRLRAESDAILVGAGTVRADDPSLTVRLTEGRDPRRVVLGRAPAGAKVHPCDEVEGDVADVIAGLGDDGVVQLLVEGGATVAGELHRRGLVDRYVLYLAPALFGGDDATPLFTGQGAATIADVWRGRIVDVTRLGADIRIDLEAA